MNYLNDKKEAIFFNINADYRALFQDNHHNVSECEDLHCSDTQCYEYRQEQKYKYIYEK